MLTRRSLLATVLGALGISFVSEVSEPMNVPIAELFISVSMDVSHAVTGIHPEPRFTDAKPNASTFVSIGSLIIRDRAEADAFLSSMVKAIATADRRKA